MSSSWQVWTPFGLLGPETERMLQKNVESIKSAMKIWWLKRVCACFLVLLFFFLSFLAFFVLPCFLSFLWGWSKDYPFLSVVPFSSPSQHRLSSSFLVIFGLSACQVINLIFVVRVFSSPLESCYNLSCLLCFFFSFLLDAHYLSGYRCRHFSLCMEEQFCPIMWPLLSPY